MQSSIEYMTEIIAFVYTFHAAERTNSAIGDAGVDGASIEWECYKRFHGMRKEAVSG